MRHLWGAFAFVVAMAQGAGVAPTFTSPNSGTLTVGTPGGIGIGVTGSPVPTASVVGALPGGVAFSALPPPAVGQYFLMGIPSPGTAGVYPLTIIATNGVPPDASQAFTLTILAAPTAPRSNQTIQFTNPGTQGLSQAPFALSATATSGLPVTFTSATPSVCSVSGSMVTLLAPGTCTIDADQAGDATYNPAQRAVQSFSIVAALPARASNISTRMQVLTGDNVMIGGAANKTVAIVATGPHSRASASPITWPIRR